MIPKQSKAVCLAMAILLVATPMISLNQARAQSQTTTLSIQPALTCCSQGSPLPPGSTFTVAVELNLASGESINGFDVRVNYTNPHSNSQVGTLQAVGLTYSTNVFARYSPQVSADCVDGIGRDGFSCASDDSPTPGQVHLAEAVLGTVAITGPLTGSLFNITFTVTGSGLSVFYFDRTNLINPQDPSNPSAVNPHFIPTLALNGGFANMRVVSFFNYQTTNPSISPSVLPEIPVSFDASQSINSYNQGYLITSYLWDFGDGTPGVNTTSQVYRHTFTAAGIYNVNLTVADSNRNTGSFVWPVNVLPMLGNLQIFVEDSAGTAIREGVIVQVFNSSSSLTPFLNESADQAGEADLNRLIPGTYLLKFQSSVYEPGSKQETVVPGFTQRDVVALNHIPSAPNYTETIFLVTFAVVISILIAAIVLKKRQLNRQSGKRYRKGRTVNK